MTLYCDTPEWHLAAYLRWVPVGYPKQLRCSCRGWGHFNDSDNCRLCDGSGYTVKQYPDEKQPPTPRGLEAHMQKAWKEFFAAEPLEEPVPWPYSEA